MAPEAPGETLREACLRVFDRGSLAAKLLPLGDAVLRDPPAAPVLRGTPARDAGLSPTRGAPPLPRPAALGDPAARAACLARFAHHELMAAELFAWALLRWPGLPRPLRRALGSALADEQRHCGLYLARLAAHGSSLAEHARSGYLLRALPALARSPHGPPAFLAAVGLTFEQANLDFAPLYADGFRRGGDPESAAVCEAVHADEIRHVRIAASWLPRLAGGTDLDGYRKAVPFPLGPARAKGRRFDADARREAGLSEAFIECVRTARSSQERGGRSRR